MRQHRAWIASVFFHLLVALLLFVLLSNQPMPSSESGLQVDLLASVSHHPFRRMPFYRLSRDTVLAKAPLVAGGSVQQHVHTAPMRFHTSATFLPEALTHEGVPSGILESMNPGAERGEPSRLAAPTPRSMSSAARKPLPVDRPTPMLPSTFVAGSVTSDPMNALDRIARHIINTHEQAHVDIVFLIDASQSMENNIRAVARYLGGMVHQLSQSGLDVQFGLVSFRHSLFFSLMGWNVEVTPLTSDIGHVQEVLRSIECIGGERTLDAISTALERIKFRPQSERRLILVTDEYVSGDTKRIQVMQAIREMGVRMDVIGKDEWFQREVAKRTGGIWQPIRLLDY